MISGRYVSHNAFNGAISLARCHATMYPTTQNHDIPNLTHPSPQLWGHGSSCIQYGSLTPPPLQAICMSPAREPHTGLGGASLARDIARDGNQTRGQACLKPRLMPRSPKRNEAIAGPWPPQGRTWTGRRFFAECSTWFRCNVCAAAGDLVSLPASPRDAITKILDGLGLSFGAGERKAEKRGSDIS